MKSGGCTEPRPSGGGSNFGSGQQHRERMIVPAAKVDTKWRSGRPPGIVAWLIESWTDSALLGTSPPVESRYRKVANANHASWGYRRSPFPFSGLLTASPGVPTTPPQSRFAGVRY